MTRIVHKPKLLTVTVPVLFLVTVIGLFYVLSRADKNISQLDEGSYKVSVIGQVSWDNYCSPNKIIIENSKFNIKQEFNVSDSPYDGPCRYPRFSIYLNDINHDGNKDVEMRVGAFDVESFIYDPKSNSFIAQKF